jgi:hypothetical protein
MEAIVADLSRFPYFEIQFDKQGTPFDAKEVKQALDFLKQDAAATDLFVIAHGWNNDMAEARTLYRDFFSRVREVVDSGSVPGSGARKFAIIAVLWPSKKFADDELKPSGAAGAESAVTVALLQTQLEHLKGVFDNADADKLIAKAKALVPQLEDSAAARSQFADLVRALPGDKSGTIEDASDRFFKLSGDEVMNRLAKPVLAAPPAAHFAGGAAHIGTGTGAGTRVGPAGAAAGLGGFFSGIRSAARNLLNFTTYYQMKERAGAVGQGGVSDVIRKVRAQSPHLKIHLIGHSFGGRLVTAAALGAEGQAPVKLDSMTLLQAAFSHHGFAQKYDDQHDGFFRRIVLEGRVSGPTLVTCTVNDQAVGTAYPLASLIAGQNASALGDANDPYGGIGRNGAQHTPEAVAGNLGAEGSAYSFQAGKIYNLNADQFIQGHSDICKREVAYALLKAVATT